VLAPRRAAGSDAVIPAAAPAKLARLPRTKARSGCKEHVRAPRRRAEASGASPRAPARCTTSAPGRSPLASSVATTKVQLGRAVTRGLGSGGDPVDLGTGLFILDKTDLALPDTLEKTREHPLTNFDERSLLRLATAAGFTGVHVRLPLDEVAAVQTSWEGALATSLLPGAPTLGDALAEHYTAEERERFERRLRPLFERGAFPPEVRAIAYLWAHRAP